MMTGTGGVGGWGSGGLANLRLSRRDVAARRSQGLGEFLQIGRDAVAGGPLGLGLAHDLVRSEAVGSNGGCKGCSAASRDCYFGSAVEDCDETAAFAGVQSAHS